MASLNFAFLEATPKQIDYQYDSFILYYKAVDCWVSSYSFSSAWFQKDERYTSLNYNSIMVNVSQNTTNQKRIGYIDFKVQDFQGNEETFRFTIEQSSGKPLFIINDTTIYIPNTQSSKGIGITLDSSFNGTPTITSDVDWLSGTYIYQGIDSTINVTSERNVFDKREGHLTVSYKSETEYEWQIPSVSYSQVITVIQEGNAEAPSIKFSTDSVALDAEGMVGVIVGYESYLGARIRNITQDGDFFTATLQTNHINVNPKSSNLNENVLRGMIYVTITDATSKYLTTYGIEVLQNTINVTLSPNTLSYTSEGKVSDGSSNAVKINNNGYDIQSVEISDSADWIVTTIDSSKRVIFIDNVSTNDTLDTREGEVKIKIGIDMLGDTVQLNRQFKIVQDGKDPLTEEPIWKDTVISLNKNRYGDYKYYRLVNQDTNEEIYRGQLFFINDTVEINVADIAKDYINYNKYPFDNVLTNNDGYVNLSFEISSDNKTFEFLTEYHLFNNYEYDYLGVRLNHITDPIQDYCDRRQYFIYSVQDYVDNDGDTNVILEQVTAYGSQQNTFKISNGQYTMALRLYGSTSVSVSTTYSKQFEVRDTCCDYCLYYMNRMGGWSWILINGETLKNNKITTNSYHKNVSNLKSSNFQKYNYLKQISESWKLNTEYLTDEQSRKMEDLLTSNLVYLHDLNEDRLIAVTIDETSVDLKTFSNQKRKPYIYSFTVTNSQQKVRR